MRCDFKKSEAWQNAKQLEKIKPGCSRVTRDNLEPDALHPAAHRDQRQHQSDAAEQSDRTKIIAKKLRRLLFSLATILMNVGMVPLHGCCFGKAGANDKLRSHIISLVVLLYERVHTSKPTEFGRRQASSSISVNNARDGFDGDCVHRCDVSGVTFISSFAGPRSATTTGFPPPGEQNECCVPSCRLVSLETG